MFKIDLAEQGLKIWTLILPFIAIHRMTASTGLYIYIPVYIYLYTHFINVFINVYV